MFWVYRAFRGFCKVQVEVKGGKAQNVLQQLGPRVGCRGDKGLHRVRAEHVAASELLVRGSQQILQPTLARLHVALVQIRQIPSYEE